MANSPQARKRARQNTNRREHNGALRSLFRTSIKKVLRALRDGNYEDATTTYKAAVSVIDRVADKGLFHKNKAARHKSRLNARVKALAST